MKPYRRKLSGEDAETGTILITKDRWRAFPRPTHLEAGHFRHLLDFSKGARVEVEIPDDGVRSIRNG